MAVVKTVERKPEQARAIINIEVSSEDLKARYAKELQSFQATYKMPGFRQGKVPIEMIEKQYTEALTAKAAERLVATAYAEAVKENGLQPYSDPSLSDFLPDLAKGFKTTATVDLFPSVTLGPVEKVHAVRDRITAGDEDLDRELERLRESMAELATREDGLREGDVVLMDLKAFDMDGKELPDAAMPAYRVEAKKNNMPEDMLKGIKGMKPGEEKDIQVKYPEDFPAKKLAGQKVRFNVKVSEVKEKRLPELNDALAADVDPKFKTLDELKADIRKHLDAAASHREENLFDSRILAALGDASKYSIPDTFLDEKTAENFEDFLRRLKWDNVTIERYCEMRKTTPEKVKEEIRKHVLDKTREELAWLEVAKQQDLKVEQSDLEAEIKAMSERSQATPEQTLAYLKKSDRLSGLASSLLRRKSMEYLRKTVTEKKGKQLKFSEAMSEE
jgi:trigger factor